MVEAKMDEARRTAFRETLDELLRDRARLDGAIAILSEKLGVGSHVLIQHGENDQPVNDATDVRDVGPVQVGEGEFYGLSQTKAARRFLERAGRTRPQKTEDILAAITRGGIRVGGKDPAGLLYRLMLRDKAFRRVGTSLWGLDAWYPPRKPAKGEQEAEPDRPDDGDAGSETPSEEAPTE
jgi:hypothetical protein